MHRGGFPLGADEQILAGGLQMAVRAGTQIELA
jgi:hypothetical protein